MSVLSIHKTTALPGTLEKNSIYLVAPPGKPDYVELYVTSADGASVRRILNEADIQAMIDASNAASSGLQIVADIGARDALSPINGQHVLVIDATGDTTVNSGAASYVWRAATSQWIKLTEYESLDLTLTWENLAGKPLSNPADIDAAVDFSHRHDNLRQLGKIGEDDEGNFTYNGLPPRARLETAAW